MKPNTMAASIASSYKGAMKDFTFLKDQHGKAGTIVINNGVRLFVEVGSNSLNAVLKEAVRDTTDKRINTSQLKELNADLQAYAETLTVNQPVWRRYAKIPDGIEIDLGGDDGNIVRITAGNVSVTSNVSQTIFYRPAHSKPIAEYAEDGDYKLLKQYVNLDHANFTLLVGWLSYTMAHPKFATTSFVFLTLIAGQGGGKSTMSRLIKELIDPTTIDIEVFPRTPQDLAISARQSHVACYDNMRGIPPQMSDALCCCATGGTFTTRKLYADAELSVLNLHCAVVLNGIYDFVGQPDLAQRCLTLRLGPIQEMKSEIEMYRDFKNDLASIRGGLYRLISKIFEYYPHTKSRNPARMIDFSNWLVAFSRVQGANDEQQEHINDLYLDAIVQAQQDALLDNIFSATVLKFCDSLTEEWSGLPAELFRRLSEDIAPHEARQQSWPNNAIAFSKRLSVLDAPLRTQGIHLKFGRGSERYITICKKKYAQKANNDY
jgi:hypothetical protein